MIERKKQDPTIAKLLPPAAPQGGIRYVPSQFALAFRRGKGDYLFHTLTRQLVEGCLPASALAGEGWDELIRARFLVPEGKDECALYNQVSALLRAYRRREGVFGYTILPTLGCNARCVYCYEEGRAPVTMSPETVEQTLRYILDSRGAGRIHLSWFGGEPLLGISTIDRICQGLRDAGVDYRSAMVSNGSLITPEIIEKMKGDWRLNKIQISMDGAEPDYAARKRYAVPRDDYHRVMESMSRLSEAGIRVSIRCNVDEENWPRIPRFLEELRAGVAHKKNISLYFALLNDVRMGAEDLAMWEKLIPAQSLVQEAGFRSRLFLSPGARFRVFHCMADSGSVVICPDGSLTACEHCPPGSSFGNVWQGVTDEAARQRFCRVDQTREKCRRCPFLPECTSFAACPVHDTHCREIYKILTVEALGRLVERKARQETEPEEAPVC